MRKTTGFLLSLLILTLPLAGCIGGEEFDTTEYENQIFELEAMLEEKNQTLTDKESEVIQLENNLAGAFELLFEYEEKVANLEYYRDSLLIQLENSNNSVEDILHQLEITNSSLEFAQSQITSLEVIINELSVLLDSSNATIEDLQSGWSGANSTINSLIEAYSTATLVDLVPLNYTQHCDGPGIQIKRRYGDQRRRRRGRRWRTPH